MAFMLKSISKVSIIFVAILSTLIKSQSSPFYTDSSCFVSDKCDPGVFIIHPISRFRLNVAQLSIERSACVGGADSNQLVIQPTRQQGVRKSFNVSLPLKSTFEYTGSLYIPSDWRYNSRLSQIRRTELWVGTSYGQIMTYPAIAFANGGVAGPRFEIFNGTKWSKTEIGVMLNTWSFDFTIRLTRETDLFTLTEFLYNGKSISNVTIRASEIRDVYMQSYNYGFNYPVFWSGLKATSSVHPSVEFYCPQTEVDIELASTLLS